MLVNNLRTHRDCLDHRNRYDAPALVQNRVCSAVNKYLIINYRQNSESVKNKCNGFQKHICQLATKRFILNLDSVFLDASPKN